MLSDIMKHYELIGEFQNAGFFETENHKNILKELKTAIKLGRLVALTGIVGCGKTITLRHLQKELEQEKDILVSKSLCVDKDRIKLGTLIMALFYDLATEKNFTIPSQPERRERKLRELIKKRQKSIALFIDEAHDLHGKTLVGLKRLIEMIQDSGGTLSVLLVGHPKLRNDLRKATMEEIGSRTTVLKFEGIKDQRKEYINWLLNKCTAKGIKKQNIFTDAAIDMLTKKLVTPLQIDHYLTLALEEGYKIGQKPITPEVIDSILAKDLDAVEAELIRQGYNVKVLAKTLNVRPVEIRAFLHGQLSPGRTQTIKEELLAVGIPL